MSTGRWRMAMLLLFPTISAQAIVTIRVSVCPASSSLISSYSDFLPGYTTSVSGLTPSTTVMGTSPTTFSSSTSGAVVQKQISSLSLGAGSTSPYLQPSGSLSSSPPSSSSQTYASGQNFTSPDGVTYEYEGNAALSGTTVVAASSGHRARQAESTGGDPFLECVNSCDQTASCQALTYLGTNCILYGTVTGVLMVVGARSAINEIGFHGFENFTTSSTASMVVSTSSLATQSRGATTSSISVGTLPVVFASAPTSSTAASLQSSALFPDSTQNQASSGATTSSVFSYIEVASSSAASMLTAATSHTYSTMQPATVTDYALSSASSTSTQLVTSSSASMTANYSAFFSSIGLESVEASLSPSFSSSSTTATADYSAFFSSVGLESAEASLSPSSSSSSHPQTSMSTSSAGSSPSSSLPSALASAGAMSSTSPSISVQTAVSAVSGSSSRSASTLVSTSSSGATSSNASPSSSVGSTSPSLAASPAFSTVSTSNSISHTTLIPQGTSSISSLAGIGSSASKVASSSMFVSSSPVPTPTPSSLASLSASSSLTTILTSSSPTSSSAPSSQVQSTVMALQTTTSTPAPSSSSSIPAATPVRNTGKRGLCYTNDTLTLDYSLSGQNSLVSWGYDYYYSRYTGNDTTFNPALTFVPMLFNDDSSLLSVWPTYAQQAIASGSDSLLSFNEPDSCYSGSACMTVNASVTTYMNYIQPFAGRVKLGAPAVTNGGPPSSLTWLGQFLGNCTSCTIDFVPLHWYSNVYAFSYLQYYVEEAYNLTFQYRPNGIPIWVTEFGIDSSGGTDAQYQAFLEQALPWLDAVPYVQRYAYFYDGPGYLINADGSGLSAQGVIYNSYTQPCPNWDNSAGHC